MEQNNTVTFSRKGTGKSLYNRSSNAIVTYVMLSEGRTPTEIAKALNVNLRSVYRYIKSVKSAREVLDNIFKTQ